MDERPSQSQFSSCLLTFRLHRWAARTSPGCRAACSLCGVSCWSCFYLPTATSPEEHPEPGPQDREAAFQPILAEHQPCVGLPGTKCDIWKVESCILVEAASLPCCWVSDNSTSCCNSSSHLWNGHDPRLRAMEARRRDGGRERLRHSRKFFSSPSSSLSCDGYSRELLCHEGQQGLVIEGLCAEGWAGPWTQTLAHPTPELLGEPVKQASSFTYLPGAGSLGSPISFLRRGKWRSLQRGSAPPAPREPAANHVSDSVPYAFMKIRGDPLLQGDPISGYPKISFVAEIPRCQVTRAHLHECYLHSIVYYHKPVLPNIWMKWPNFRPSLIKELIFFFPVHLIIFWK